MFHQGYAKEANLSSHLFYCYFCSLGIPVLQVLGSLFWYLVFIAVAFIES